MGKKPKPLKPAMQAWIEARKRHRLTHAQVQMARELGLDQAKLGKIDNHKQEQWKIPLPEYIEELYFKRFGKTTPDTVMSIEERVRLHQQKKEAKRDAKAAQKTANHETEEALYS